MKMTLNSIKLASRHQFALNGYEGASLATIASEVGIKKQSLYTYYKGKDELFLDVFEDSWNREMDFVNQYFSNSFNSTIENSLHGFLKKYLERYEKEDNTNFFLRTIFYPPLHLKDEINKRGNNFIDHIQKRVETLFEEIKLGKDILMETDKEHAAIAFIALLDGMIVEMLYGGLHRASVRLNASWGIYWRGVR